MAVTSGLTSFEDFESPGATFVGIGSGPAAGDNTDVFIEGAQSGGRRVDNVTDKGFMAQIAAVDLSGAGIHIKQWVFCFHWSSVTGLTARLLSGTTAFDNHEFGVGVIPVTGGWLALWLDISRTPDSTGASGLDEANVTDIGAYIDIANVGGTGDNFIIDEIMYGTDGLTWSGAGGDMSDFRSYEVTNAEGNVLTRDGIDFVLSRLTIGDSSATGFTDAGFTIVFPDQPLVASTFMGLTFDLQHASTAIDISNATIQSGDPAAATNRPDLIVTGTSGTFDMDSVTLSGLRIIDLTDACSITNSTIVNTGTIDATTAGTAGATLSGTKIVDSTVAANTSALIWDVNADPNGELDNMTFDIGANAHHAIEFGLTSPLTMTLTGIDFVGFNASDANNDSTFHIKRTTGTVTINIIGGSGNVSFRTDGATVVIVQNPVALTLHVIAQAGGADISGARAYILAGATGPLPFEDSVTITRVTTTASVAHTAHGLDNGDKVLIEGADQDEYNGVQTISNVSANAYDYTVSGSPTTPATGTIVSTAVIIDGTTDGSGLISDTRTYSSDQDIAGRVRQSSSTPFYKTSPVTGVIDKDIGLNITVQMVLDE